MSGTTTPNYGFALPTIGGNQDSWGNLLNANWTAADSVIHTLASGYLPLTGGGISGSLTVAGTVSTASEYYLSVSGAYFASNANYTYLVQDSANWQWRYNRSNGTMQYLRGGDGLALFTIDGGGTASITGQALADSFNSIGGRFYVGGSTNYYVGRDSSDSTWRFVENGAAKLSLDATGSLAVTNNLTCAARMTCNDIMNNSGAFFVQGSSVDYFARGGDGAWRWVENNVVSLTLDAVGNLTARGAVHGTNVTALEARIEALTARVADLEALRLA